MFARSWAWRIGVVLASVLVLGALAGAAWAETVRIGYQKYGTLVLLKEKGWLEPALKALGADTAWIEFPAGPPMLEALNVGAIDLATTGETPPIFAQAAGAAMVYVGAEPPAPHGEAILVPARSPIFKVGELRSHKVVLNKGSNVHWLWVRALEQAGLDYKNVQTIYLAPADARAAFQSGQVDAWVIWDPFLAAAEADLGARILADGDGLVANRQFYLATRTFATEKPQLVEAVLSSIARMDRWAAANPQEVAPLLAQGTGVKPEAIGRAVARLTFGVGPVTADILADQQKIADAFAQLRLIPSGIKVSDDGWVPPS